MPVAERMVADLRGDIRGERPAPHHRVRVGLRQRCSAQLPGAACDCAKEWPFRVIRDAGAFEIRVQVRLECVVAGHGVRLAALFTQTHPQVPLLYVDVF